MGIFIIAVVLLIGAVGVNVSQHQTRLSRQNKELKAQVRALKARHLAKKPVSIKRR